MENKNKLALIILDGWGHGVDDAQINAVKKAQTPFVDHLYQHYTNSELYTSGANVGLPDGQMGNSEVGHLNIGAGRVVYQPLVRINKAIQDGSFAGKDKLQNALEYAKANDKKVHFLGLLSDGGVHSHIYHLKELCRVAGEKGLKDFYVHPFMDGRDTDPKSGVGYIQELQQQLKETGGEIASLIGRYYAMDRDKRWERVKHAYDLLVKGKGEHYQDPAKALMDSYQKEVTDEFLNPVTITNEEDEPKATIEEGDVVIFFNFRTDRGRELTMALSQQEYPEQDMKPLQLYYLTMTEYDPEFEGVDIIFEDENIKNTLGEFFAQKGLNQLRIAETEKYPHVTYFFNGGREEAFETEQRLMIASPKVATYDLQPEMSANEVTDAVIQEIENHEQDLIVLNFANPDMVGHTGDFDAVVKALETIDQCAKKVVEKCLEKGYISLVTADHGNSDFMVNEDGSPNTAHTTNPVPFILVDDQKQGIKLKDGKLADIAPTILALLGLDQPDGMTGDVLVEFKMQTT